ncbi:hypothetical protein TNCV_2350491 [Trichonephila clavipes]|uniref:Uncharacterized protein n=1 Tax=Trichonephila clavipes TaxID=2585209 RepID=A0A8X6SMW2_TRICX|nr:hypothetical protein TNCV_2350491 [Trichonephila clavipes]
MLLEIPGEIYNIVIYDDISEIGLAAIQEYFTFSGSHLSFPASFGSWLRTSSTNTIDGAGLDHVLCAVKLFFDGGRKLEHPVAKLSVVVEIVGFSDIGSAAEEKRTGDDKKGPSESVQEFAARINKLGTQIFQSGNSAQNTAVRNANDQLLQSRFISGLRNDIRRFVLSRDPLNLDESINAALIEEQNMKLNQIASEERSGLSSAQTENPVLSALADRLEEINLRVPVQLQLVNQGEILLTEGKTFSNAFIVAFKDIDRRSVERSRGTNALPVTSPRRNAASKYSVSSHPGLDGRHVHFRESAFRDNYAAPRHPVRGSHTNSGNRGFQRYNRNETLNSRGESRI